MKERTDITKMYEILKENSLIKKWFFGHFHKSQITEYEWTEFHMLGINEFKEVYQDGEE